MKSITKTQIQQAACAACLCGAFLAAVSSHAAPAKPSPRSLTAFTWYVTNGSLPPQYAHHEELSGQVTARAVSATYTETHFAPNPDKHGYHSVVFTWHGSLPAALQRQYRALAEHIAFEKLRPGPPRIGGGLHVLDLVYADGHKAGGIPTNSDDWASFQADVAQLAHSRKK